MMLRVGDRAVVALLGVWVPLQACARSRREPRLDVLRGESGRQTHAGVTRVMDRDASKVCSERGLACVLRQLPFQVLRAIHAR